MSEKNKSKYYLPTILLGVIVAVIFLLAIFTYQVNEGEKALVLTAGKPTAVVGPGLHFRWPQPIQEVAKYDIRKRKFSGNTGLLEETSTSDKHQVVIGICVYYAIVDVEQFRKANGLKAVEDYLSNQMSNAKKSVIGRHSYDELINADAEKMKLEQMKQEILTALKDDLMEKCGIEIFQVDFTSIGVPEKTAEAIAGAMRQNRETLAAEEREKGLAEAKQIRIKAETEKEKSLTEARAKAKAMVAEGNAEAAKYYAQFSRAPALAAFLQKLDALKSILENKTTLILHTGNEPFDIFNSPVDTIMSELQKKNEPVKK